MIGAREVPPIHVATFIFPLNDNTPYIQDDLIFSAEHTIFVDSGKGTVFRPDKDFALNITFIIRFVAITIRILFLNKRAEKTFSIP